MGNTNNTLAFSGDNNYIHLRSAIDDLEKNIIHYKFIGNIGILITAVLFIILSYFVYHLFEGTLSSAKELGLHDTKITYNIDPKKGVEEIIIRGNEKPEKKAKKLSDHDSFVIVEGEAKVSKTIATDNTSMVVLSIVVYILRTSLLGTFVLLSLVYTIKFTTSSFDQAVRFTKRKHASQFLLEMFTQYEPEIENIPKVMDAFSEWNVIVESAYTEVKANEKAFKTFFEHLGKLDEESIKRLKLK